jgi:hypothetical protein
MQLAVEALRRRPGSRSARVADQQRVRRDPPQEYPPDEEQKLDNDFRQKQLDEVRARTWARLRRRQQAAALWAWVDHRPAARTGYPRPSWKMHPEHGRPACYRRWARHEHASEARRSARPPASRECRRPAGLPGGAAPAIAATALLAEVFDQINHRRGSPRRRAHDGPGLPAPPSRRSPGRAARRRRSPHVAAGIRTSAGLTRRCRATTRTKR